MSTRPSRPAPSLGGDRPDPRRPRLWVETWSPQTRRPVEVLALNDWLHGFYVHFLPGGDPRKDRTRPCTLSLGACAWCGFVANRTWKAYLGVAAAGGRRPSILEVTLGCWDCTPALREHDGCLRGTGWRFFREKDSSRSRLLAEKTLSILKTPRFGKVDVLSVLSRMWETDFDALAGLAETRDGEGGWGNPGHTEPPFPGDQAGQTGPFPTAERMDPEAAARFKAQVNAMRGKPKQ
jgi:hypothetical protein